MDILNEFGVNPLLLAAQVVNFLILLFILKKFLYGPILKVLEKRKLTIEQSLKHAEEIEKKLVELSDEEEKRLIKASGEGEKIIKQASESSVAIIEESRKKAEEVYERIVEQGRVQLQSDREQMTREINKRLAEVVTLALEKVTDKVMDKNDQKELIKKSIKEI